MSMEAVKMFHKAESRRAVWHVFELFLIYSLSSDVVVVDFISCIKKRKRSILKKAIIFLLSKIR